MVGPSTETGKLEVGQDWNFGDEFCCRPCAVVGGDVGLGGRAGARGRCR